MKRISTHRLFQLLRAIVLAIVAMPGAGVALVAVACSGDAPDARPAAPVVHASPATRASDGAPAPRVTLPPIAAVTEAAPARVEEAAPEPAPAASPAPAAEVPRVTARRPVLARSDGELAIVEGVFATGVEDRLPTGVASHFGQDVGKVWAWVRVKNSGAPTQIQMVWKHDGKVRSRMTLDVGTSSGWRTWSRKAIKARDVGRWTVEIQGPAGEVLDVMTFDISAGDTAWMDGEGGC